MNSHELVLYRNIFYKNTVLYQIIIFFLLVATLGTHFWFIRILRKDQVKPVYFMTNQLGQILPKYPLSLPVYSDEEVALWTDKKIKYLLSMNFSTHKKIINEAAAFFNPIGYVQYMTALDKSRLLYALNFHKYVAIVHTIEPIKVARKSMIGNNIHAWRLEGQYEVQYFNNNNTQHPFVQQRNMIILVRREEFSLYPEGLSIMTVIG